MRRAARRDANEPGLVALARQIGALCWPLDEPVDWLVWWRGSWHPTEIKNPDGKNRYTEQQVQFLIAAKERSAVVWTWRTEADVLSSLGARVSA